MSGTVAGVGLVGGVDPVHGVGVVWREEFSTRRRPAIVTADSRAIDAGGRTAVAVGIALRDWTDGQLAGLLFVWRRRREAAYS